MASVIPVGLPPREAVEHFRRKGMQVSFAWQDVAAEQHARAFTVAKVARLDILEDIRTAVDAAIAEGETFADFKRRTIPVLQEKGWWGRARMVDPADGEERDVQLGSVRRLETIYDTNLRTQHAAGAWSLVQRTKDRRPYLRYVHLDNAHPRKEHQAWHGLVLPVDDRFWLYAYPPNGWGCHCSVQQLSERDVARYGYKVSPSPGDPITTAWENPRTGEVRHLPQGISPGWDHNPGVAAEEVAARVMGERLAGAAADVGAAAWADAASHVVPALERSYQRWAEAVIAQRDPGGDVHPVGAISPNVIAFLRSQHEAPAAAGIVARARDVARIAKGSGPELLHALPTLLTTPRAVLYDAAGKELVYVFSPPDGNEGTRLIARVARAAKAKRPGTVAVNRVTDLQVVGVDTLTGHAPGRVMIEGEM